MSREVLQCVAMSGEISVQDLLQLRATCRAFALELTGHMPGDMDYILPNRNPDGTYIEDQQAADQVAYCCRVPLSLLLVTLIWVIERQAHAECFVPGAHAAQGGWPSYL